MDRPVVCSLESRRQTEIAALIKKTGATPFVAPSMRELPLESNTETLEFVDRLIDGRIEVMVFLTGVGAQALMDVALLRYAESDVLAALRRCEIAVRGPKPAAVLKRWDVPVHVRAPEPNTWRELLISVDESDLVIQGKTLAVQEYGQPNHELSSALVERGAVVESVIVYRWDLPADTEPLEEAIRRVVARDFDIFMITSAQQIRHALQIAAKLGLESEFRIGLAETMLASIGPTATEALRELKLRVDLEPTRPKMGPLVRESIETWRAQNA